MLNLVNIYRQQKARPDGKSYVWYELLCGDDYVAKNLMCGQPSKIVRCSEYVLNKALGGDPQHIDITPEKCEAMVGKNVYVMYNEQGYTCFIRFYDEGEKQGGNNSSSSGKAAANASEPVSLPECPPDDNSYPFN